MVSFSDPEAPRDISVKMEEDTTIIVTWLPPEHPNGKIDLYQMAYAGYNLTRQVEKVICIHLWCAIYNVGVITFTAHTCRM